MRDPRVRLIFVALILAFPAMIIATSGQPLDRTLVATLVAVESILVIGLGLAARTRGELRPSEVIATLPIIANAPRVMAGRATSSRWVSERTR